jgi:hypothetical protein
MSKNTTIGRKLIHILFIIFIIWIIYKLFSLLVSPIKKEEYFAPLGKEEFVALGCDPKKEKC